MVRWDRRGRVAVGKMRWWVRKGVGLWAEGLRRSSSQCCGMVIVVARHNDFVLASGGIELGRSEICGDILI